MPTSHTRWVVEAPSSDSTNVEDRPWERPPASEDRVVTGLPLVEVPEVEEDLQNSSFIFLCVVKMQKTLPFILSLCDQSAFS
jgi:hypothetical protein